MQIVRTCTRCDVAKDQVEFYFHASRGRYSARCKACLIAKVKEHADANRERVRAANRIAGRKFRDANRDHERARTLAAYYATHDKQKARLREHRANNLGLYAAKEAKRRAGKLRATPTWADLNAIEALYREAQRQTEMTGMPVHVDHVVPLKSERVCGLHCEANLQLLPGKENLSKSNRWWPDI